MKINVTHCNKTVTKGVYTYIHRGQFEVLALKIRRSASFSNRMLNRYRYEVDYISIEGMVNEVTYEVDVGNIRSSYINRKLNPHFKPKNIEFINDEAVLYGDSNE